MLAHCLVVREPEDCRSYARGRVGLLGDAAHLTAAALGQVSTPGAPALAACAPSCCRVLRRIMSWPSVHALACMPCTTVLRAQDRCQTANSSLLLLLRAGHEPDNGGLTPQALSAYEAARCGSSRRILLRIHIKLASKAG